MLRHLAWSKGTMEIPQEGRTFRLITEKVKSARLGEECHRYRDRKKVVPKEWEEAQSSWSGQRVYF